MNDSTDDAVELNLDGLVGPTHSYAGLSYGNLASQRSGREPSNPKQAALEGLRKMKRLADLGVPQAVLPPQERPDLEALRRIGFSGSDAKVLDVAAHADPHLLAACCSASSMWAANAATVSPSADTADGRVHFTPANLVSQFHRSLETRTTGVILRTIFSDERHFAHHDPLPAADTFADEGAANHIRLCPGYGQAGVEVFVYGRSALGPREEGTRRFPARQTQEASVALMLLNQVRSFIPIHQNPIAIDAGAFHADVVAVGNLNVLFYHESAFVEEPPFYTKRTASESIRTVYRRDTGDELIMLRVSEDDVPLADAVETYLFNSQLVRIKDGRACLVAPTECEKHPRVRPYLDALINSAGPIHRVEFVDVRQSMRNGGGPACLRLRVALTAQEFARVHTGVILTDSLYEKLTAWVERHYRDRLEIRDLHDPKLLDESRAALDALTSILKLGSIYRFQRQ